MKPVAPAPAPAGKPQEPAQPQPQQPAGAEEVKGGSKKWLWAVLIVVVLGLLAYFLTRGEGEEATAVPDTTEVAMPDTDTIPSVTPDSATPAPTTGEGESEEPAATPTPSQESATSTPTPAAQQPAPSAQPAAPAAAPQGTVEEMANDVLRDAYGNGRERKDRLGAAYSEVQSRVNEMYRQGLVK